MNSKYVNAALVALMLSALGASSAAAVTSQQPITGNIQSLQCDQIDTQQSVKLTLEKTGDNPNNAGEHVVISGARFTLKRVQGINLKTDCDRAKTLTVDQAQALGFDKEFSVTTDAQGVASIDLPGGLYLVEELAPSDPNLKYRISSPQLMFLPTGNVTGTEWQYDTVRIVKGTSPTTPPATPSQPASPSPSTVPSPSPSKPVTPAPSQPGTPSPSKPVTPAPTQPGTPSPSKPVTPAPSQPGTPSPSASQPASPAPSSSQPAPAATPSTPPATPFQLPHTGASVAGILVLATGLIFLGIALVRRRNKNES